MICPFAWKTLIFKKLEKNTNFLPHDCLYIFLSICWGEKDSLHLSRVHPRIQQYMNCLAVHVNIECREGCPFRRFSKIPKIKEKSKNPHKKSKATDKWPCSLDCPFVQPPPTYSLTLNVLTGWMCAFGHRESRRTDSQGPSPVGFYLSDLSSHHTLVPRRPYCN